LARGNIIRHMYIIQLNLTQLKKQSVNRTRPVNVQLILRARLTPIKLLIILAIQINCQKFHIKISIAGISSA